MSNLRSASIRGLASSVILLVVSLVSSVVMARGLGVEGRGLYASALLVATFARGLAQLGLGQSYVIAVRRRQSLDPYLLSLQVSGIVFFVALTIASLLIFATPLMASPKIALATVVMSALLAIFDFQLTSLQVQSSLAFYSRFRWLAPFMILLGMLLFWWFQLLTPTIAVILHGAATAMLIPLIFRAIRGVLSEQPNSTSIIRWKNFALHGFGYHGIAVSGMVFNNLDKVILVGSASVATFGIYTAAYGLSRFISVAQLAVGSAVYANFAGSDKGDRSGAVAALTIYRLLFFPWLGIAGVASVTAPVTVPLLLGQNFSDAVPIFVVLSFEAVMGGMCFILTQPFQAQGRTRSVLLRQLISFAPLGLYFFIDWGQPSMVLAVLLLGASSMRLASTLLQLQRDDKSLILRPWASIVEIRSFTASIFR